MPLAATIPLGAFCFALGAAMVLLMRRRLPPPEPPPYALVRIPRETLERIGENLREHGIAPTPSMVDVWMRTAAELRLHMGEHR